MNLYFIKGQHPEFDTDRDLLVEAESAEQAEALWRDYYDLDAEEDSPLSIMPVPLTGQVGAIPWDLITV